MADTDFVSRLRMNNIYPSGDSNPFGPPGPGINTGGGGVEDILNKVYPYMLDQQARQHEFINNQRAQERSDRIRQIGASQLAPEQIRFNPSQGPTAIGGGFMSPGNMGPNANRGGQGGMNVVFKDNSPKPISEFQRGQLALGKEKLAQTGQLTDRKLDQGEEKIQQTGQLKNRGYDIADKRADIYKFKAEHPNVQWQAPKGGNLMYFDPASRKMVDTGISTGSMNEQDKIRLLGDIKNEQIEQTGQNQQYVEGMREDAASARQGVTGTQRLAEIAARIKGATDKPQSNTQLNAGQKMKARELINTRPDLAPFIQQDAIGNFTVSAPEEPGYIFGNGIPKDKIDEINQFIYGKKPSD